MSAAPIAIFDSGIGGLTVYRHVRALLPAEGLLYLADHAYSPYGERTAGEIRARCHAIADWAVGEGAKALVVACNTATSAAIESLRAGYSLPVIGVEPGLKPALALSHRRRVGIMATPGTLNGSKYRTLSTRLESHGVRFIEQPCPGLAARIEGGDWHGAGTRLLLQRLLQPLLADGVDVVVLGCTHYPLVLPLIEAIAGPAVQVVDTGGAVAAQLARRLAAEGLLREGGGVGEERLCTTGQIEPLRGAVERILGADGAGRRVLQAVSF